MILHLHKVKKLEEAKGIFNFLECSNKIKKQDTNIYKKLFDTILNAKTSAESEETDVFSGFTAAINSNSNNNNNNFSNNSNFA